MAADGRLVAMASQRDSSSMKVIAVVTMSFLPGTVVASVFTIPLFDWDAENYDQIFRREYWSPRLVAYLAVTIPLMTVTFSIWALWLLITNIRDKKRTSMVRNQLGIGAIQDEAHALAQKRTNMRMME